MPKQQRIMKAYPEALRKEVTELCSNPGVNMQVLAKEYDIPVTTIYGWVKQAKRNQAKTPLVVEDARNRISQLEADLNQDMVTIGQLTADLKDAREIIQDQFYRIERADSLLKRKDREISALRELYILSLQSE